MTTTTPNMSLILPDVAITTGPQWAVLIDAAYTTIDSHDHSSGKGIRITPSGLNISSDLSFVQNNATNLRSARLFNNSAITLGVNDKTCLYSLNNELYYVDGAGNNVQVTVNGALNISSGISSLTLNDSAFFLQYFGDTTRKFRFDASAIPTATTRVLSIPDSGANDSLVTRNATQTLTNKTLTGAVVSGATAATLISGSGTLILPTSGSVIIPGSTDTLVNLSGVQTLTNKILTSNTIASFTPNGTNTITVPSATDTLAVLNTMQTLVNKTLISPVIASLNTGSYAITLPTTDGSSGQVVTTNGSGVWGFSTVATSVGAVSSTGSTVTLTNSSNRIQYITPSTNIIVTMPTTTITAGDTWYIYNQATSSANYITVQSSGGNTIAILPALGIIKIAAAVNTPTTAANWILVEKISQWVSYTPTVVGFGTVSSLSAYYKIINDSLMIRVYFISGVSTAVAANITYPTPFILNTTKTKSGVNLGGVGAFGTNATQIPYGLIDTTDTARFYVGLQDATHAGLTEYVGSTIASSGTSMALMIEVPI